MSADNAEAYRRVAPPLDENLYQPDDVEAAFISEQTGIKDPEEAKKHVVKIQKEAYAVYPFPCIRSFTFARLKAYRLPAYPDLIRLGKERKGALFLDIGCCVGNDVRKAVADGYPADQVIASDLKAEFWDIGHKLFNSTQETFPVKFLAGDVFDKNFLAPAPIVTTPPAFPTPDIPELKSLTPLHGHLSAIHASSFFHLFNEEKQAELAHLLGALLSPEPGSMIFGMHGARPERGTHSVRFGSDEAVVDMFSHGPESWKALWEDVFGKDKVEVQVVVEDANRKDIPTNEKFYWMVYSVKRSGSGSSLYN